MVDIHGKAEPLPEIPYRRFKFVRSDLDCPPIADAFIYTPRGAHTPSSEAKVIVPYLISIIDITTRAMSSDSNSHVPLIVLGAGVTGLAIANLTACDPYVDFDITIIARYMPRGWGSQAWASPFAGANLSPMSLDATDKDRSRQSC